MLLYLRDFFRRLLGVRIKLYVPGGPDEDKGMQPGDRFWSMGTVHGHDQSYYQVEIIGLERVKSRFIAHWPAIYEHVHQIVKRVIRRHLLPGEGFVALDDESYIVTFQRNADLSAACGQKIRGEIMQLFLEDHRLRKDLSVKVGVVTDDRRAAYLKWRTAEDIANGHTPEKKVYFRSSIPREHIALHTAPADGAIAAGMRPLLHRDDEGRELLPPGIEIVLAPVMSLNDGSNTCYALFSRLDMPEGFRLYGADVLPEGADDDMFCDLDSMVARNLCGVMEKVVKIQGEPTKVLCPVHYKTVANKELWQIYLAAFQPLVDQGYNSHVAMQLCGMPRALFPSEQRAPIELLRCLSSKVLVMTPIDWTSEGILGRAGATAIGVDLAGWRTAPEQVLLSRLRALMRQVNRERLSSCAFDAGPEMAAVVERAGLSHMCDYEQSVTLPLLHIGREGLASHSPAGGNGAA